jgi:hypothetical protein
VPRLHSGSVSTELHLRLYFFIFMFIHLLLLYSFDGDGIAHGSDASGVWKVAGVARSAVSMTARKLTEDASAGRNTLTIDPFALLRSCFQSMIRYPTSFVLLSESRKMLHHLIFLPRPG